MVSPPAEFPDDHQRAARLKESVNEQGFSVLAKRAARLNPAIESRQLFALKNRKSTLLPW